MNLGMMAYLVLLELDLLVASSQTSGLYVALAFSHVCTLMSRQDHHISCHTPRFSTSAPPSLKVPACLMSRPSGGERDDS